MVTDSMLKVVAGLGFMMLLCLLKSKCIFFKKKILQLVLVLTCLVFFYPHPIENNC